MFTKRGQYGTQLAQAGLRVKMLAAQYLFSQCQHLQVQNYSMHC